MENIPVAGPWITEKEIAYVTDAVTNAWYSNANMYHQRFEKAFAEYIGVQYAMALPSCTSAIHLSLLALGIGPGDEVIVPDCTWIATAAPISYVNATPVFADIDPKSWCISAKSFEECITPHTKAVIPVDLYGNMPDMDALREIAAKHNIAIIEDAAEAIGSTYKGKKAGSFGLTGVYSFHGSKTLTTGEGGILLTDRKDIYDRISFLRDHGRAPGNATLFYNSEVAYKYKMSSMQAALGLAQLERIEELIVKKRETFKWYYERLGNIDGITMNSEASDVFNSYWMVTIILDPKFRIKKEALQEKLGSLNIATRPFFHPLSSLPAYQNLAQAGHAHERNDVSYALSPYGVNLPSALNLTESQVDFVCQSVKQIIQG